MSQVRSQVILDSDEEEEDVAVEEAVGDAPVIDRTPMHTTSDAQDGLSHHAVHDAGMHATGSSEKLRREIETAQSALVEPTPSRKRRAVDDLDMTPSFNTPNAPTVKRRKSTGVQEDEKQGKLRSRSKQTSSIKANVEAAEDQWEVPEGLETGAMNAAKDAQGLETVVQKREASPNDTIMDSSSQRNSVSSRQFLSVQGPAGFETHVSDPLSPKVSSVGTCDSSNVKSRSSRASREDYRSSQLPNASEQKTSSQTDTTTSQHDELQIEIAPDLNKASTDAGPTRQQFPVVIVESKEEHITLVDPQPSSQKGKKRKSDREASVDELGSDQTVDMPKETYNPRPTRSRAARKEQDSANFALPSTPAKKSNSKLKRLRTTGSIALAERTTLCEMGFRPSQAEEALDEAKGDINRAVELLTRRGYEVSQTPKTRASRSQRSLVDHNEDFSPRNGDTDDSTSRATNDAGCEDDKEDVIRAVSESGVISNKANLDDKKVQASGDIEVDTGDDNGVDEHADTKGYAVLDIFAGAVQKEQQDAILETKGKVARLKKEHVSESHEEEQIKPRNSALAEDTEPGESKKKGRGRPKKSQNITVQDDECIVVEMDTAAETASREVLGSVDTNRKQSPEDTKESTGKGIATDDSAPQITPEKDSKKTSASPQKAHSPLNTGKVPFKVGLSRRVRIEPLLRVVRK